jgi:hypothetical protein
MVIGGWIEPGWDEVCKGDSWGTRSGLVVLFLLDKPVLTLRDQHLEPGTLPEFPGLPEGNSGNRKDFTG